MAEDNKQKSVPVASGLDANTQPEQSPADATASLKTTLTTTTPAIPVAPQPPGVDTDKASLMSQTVSQPQPTKTLGGATIEQKAHVTPEPVKPYVFDTVKFEAKIAEFNEATDKVAGKPNYNPYMYLTKNGVTEAVRQYKLGNRSKEVFDTVMRVPATIPVVDVNWVAPVPYKAELPKQLQPPNRSK